MTPRRQVKKCKLRDGGKRGEEKTAPTAGLDGKSVRELATRHDRQTEAERAAEIEAVLSAAVLSAGDQTLMMVPTELVPKIQALIQRKRGN
jgi:hypothetical protein